MNEYEKGSIVKSIAGHDKDQYYVILDQDQEYVYVVDGKIRTLMKPKKKKKKHIQTLNYVDSDMKNQIHCNRLLNSDIRKAIKKMIVSYR